ncbi:Dynamin-related protein 3A [Heracleum sosnowskyi]|uniref:Dynamin-related protein 3A n=1 Tax=Heracleum sosnowskyi TaxID=360622 RepID=A0AAD8NAM8_9APIA|nr:Dynamin-related protein 3A [Heracleum sosnowskyi]
MADSPLPSKPNSSLLGHSVIPIVNKLQDISAQLGANTPIELPQVAVVGSQSSGKSSVLEALVGRDFLPRGNDICTRRPLMLQLVRSEGCGEEEFGEFLHLPKKRFYDFDAIRMEIEAETDKEAGGNKGVSDKPIRLKIFSPNVLDITLVDLPGITKVPVCDQPSNIEAQIRTMITTYINRPSCLILAVTPANADLANSDALQIARSADPDGSRTIGVITKLDIMDRGTDARNFLLGKVIPLKLGYVGVVNRSQEDIMLKRTIKDALVAEEKFFRSRPVYNELADRCGVPQLAKQLNQILVKHIKMLLPGLKSRIHAALVSVAKEHASLGEITESKAGMGVLLLNILSDYCKELSSMIEGKNQEMSTSELSGGARIHYIFQSIFVKTLEDVDPFEGLTDDEVRTIIQNSTGPRSAFLVHDVPFEVLIRRQIARLLDPSIQCAKFIYDELVKMSRRCMANELQRFPVLRNRVDEVIRKFLRENLQPSETMIRHIVGMEMDYINTSHPSFIGGSKALEIAKQEVKASNAAAAMIPKNKDESEKPQPFENTLKSRGLVSNQVNGVVPDQGARRLAEEVVSSGNKSGRHWKFPAIFNGSDSRLSIKEHLTSKLINEPVQHVEHAYSMIHLKEPPSTLRSSEIHSEDDTVNIIVTRLLLRSYYDIVRKNIEDSVPKAIMHFLVNHTKRELHNVFIRKLYRDNLLEEMLREPEEVSIKRKRTSETLHVLQQAFQTLDELPLEADTVERGYSLPTDRTGLPKSPGLQFHL